MDIVFRIDPSAADTITFCYEHPDIGCDTYIVPYADGAERAVSRVLALYDVADFMQDIRARCAGFERARAEGRRLAGTYTLGRKVQQGDKS